MDFERIITKVLPFIHSGTQYIQFELLNHDERPVFKGDVVTDTLDIPITDVEILIGSKLVTKSNTIERSLPNIKPSYKIEKSADYDTMLINNIKNLRYFNRIRKVSQKISSKNNKRYTIIELNNRTKFIMNTQYLMSQLTLDYQYFYILIGEFVSPEFYKKGELIDGEGSVAKKELIKDLNLRITDSFENMKIHKNWQTTIDDL